MKTSLAVVGALFLATWLGVMAYVIVAGMRAPRRANGEQTTEQMQQRLAPYAAHMVHANGIPRQRTRFVGAIDQDAVITEFYPCGALNVRCLMHAKNPNLCTDETPCCGSCPDRRPPAA